MKAGTTFIMTGRRFLKVVPVLALALAIATAPPAAALVWAQSPPPPAGTVALEGTMKKVYRAPNVIVVATLDGVERIYRFAETFQLTERAAAENAGSDAALMQGRVLIYYANEKGEKVAHFFRRVDTR